MSPTPSTRLVAIVFTDMKGYSALMGQDEKRALALLEEHNRVVMPAFAAHGGRVVKTIGDAVMAEFPSSLSAVNAAMDAQRQLHDRNQGRASNDQIMIRVGIHTGDVWDIQGDLFGDGVNVAARLEPHAQPGGIAVSGEVWNQVRNKVDLSAQLKADAPMKNIARAVEVWRLTLPWLPPENPVSRQAMVPAGTSSLVPHAARVGNTALAVAGQVSGGVVSAGRKGLAVAVGGFGFMVSLGMTLGLAKKGFEAELVIILVALGVLPVLLARRLFLGPPAPKPPSADPQQEVLRVAASRGGELTLSHLVAELSVPLPALRYALLRLEVEGFAESVVREDGVLVYRFRELMAPGRALPPGRA